MEIYNVADSFYEELTQLFYDTTTEYILAGGHAISLCAWTPYETEEYYSVNYKKLKLTEADTQFIKTWKWLQAMYKASADKVNKILKRSNRDDNIPKAD